MSFAAASRRSTDGPFAEAKEVLGGYWMIQVKSRDEAIEWASRCPARDERDDRGPPGAAIRRLSGAANADAAGCWRRVGARSRCGALGPLLAASSAASIGGRDGAPTPIARSTRSGGSSRRGSSPGSRASCATSAWPRSWRRTRSSPRSSSGRESGVPDNPGAWLMATAKHRAIDRLRRSKLLERKHEELGARARGAARATRRRDLDAALDDDIGDDLLRLIFTACHPVLSTEARVGADAAAARRPHDRRDRARLPRAGADDRAAHRARQAHARRGARAVRGAARRRARARGWRRCSR